MAFTMPAWKSARRRTATLVAVFWLAAVSAAVDAAEFGIATFESRFDDRLLVADARIDYSLSGTAIEALESGVDLVIVQRLVLEQPRWWWRDVQVVDQHRRYRLAYHAISRRYVLNRLASGDSRSFRSLDALLMQLGEVEAWPVIRRDRLEPERDYRLNLETRLDVDALPRLLRTVAWTDTDWQLRSGTQTLEVRP
ncbi:DUF4390 domain-containing protein [Spiribacter vilamensis]|uniref:Uncharacterized protein DUF4390 n=1 Tax=Spiribacter vilamensis TaxID=531306 RepID=A0A4Q8D246_9GAMM|nr:DUF4390 domain-containing protein [Spiribacter vilamensis]RZU99471.1 uncharacterized protein DUF4390 [Spiribacter vilamensis]TVO61557.1 DUF4390 domain-containing protein [Spiribacter vilamensis]